MMKLQELHLDLLVGDKLAFLHSVDYSALADKGYQSFTVPSGFIDIDKVTANVAKVEYKGSQDKYRHLVGFLDLREVSKSLPKGVH